MTKPTETWTAVPLEPIDHAHNIAAAARAYLADRLDNVRPRLERLSPDGARYVACLYRDYAELLEVAELLEAGNVTAAAYAAARLNTIPRDELPPTAWAFLNEALANAT